MNTYFDNQTTRLFIATASLAGLLVIIFFIHRYLFFSLKKNLARTPPRLIDYMLDLYKIPALWVVNWLSLIAFARIFLSELSFYPYLQHINSLLLIFSLAWIAIQFIKAGEQYLQNKLEFGAHNNLDARKSLTQLKVFKGIANSIIVVLAIASSLLTFEHAKTIGLSILTSAGIIGIIFGLAAQKSLGMILSGIQLAITQPIRLDDAVKVEGEYGRIEEITLTYVIVKIWDERRLVLPVSYFLEKPFQNWTRPTAEIIGPVFLYVDYSFPVDSIRAILPEMLKGNIDWDGRVMSIQVSNSTETYKEVRILLSSTDAPHNWNLRVTVREKLIDFINANYPDAFAKIRVKNERS